MANINFEIFLGNLSFVILFLIMLFYWIEAVFAAIPKFNLIILLSTVCANLTLFFLLIIRWSNYGHFPLSNLYESLLFLSWSFTFIEFIFIVSQFRSNNFFSTFSKFLFGAKQGFEKTKFFLTLKKSKAFFLREKDFFGKTELNSQNTKSSLASVALQSKGLSRTSQISQDKESIINLSNLSENNFFTTEIIKKKVINLNINTIIGTILSPIALFTNSFATFSLPKTMQKAQALVPALQSNWLMMHVTVMMLSYAALLCGSLLSIAFLIIVWQNNKNTNKISYTEQLSNNSFKAQNTEFINQSNAAELSSSSQLPVNLLAKTLDNLSYRILGIGFPLLTIGILSGAVWANEAWGSYWSWDPKETWAFITWLVFAIYLHARITKGWEGTKPAILASFGFFTVWICYLGVNILGTGLHSYGWIQ